MFSRVRPLCNGRNEHLLADCLLRKWSLQVQGRSTFNVVEPNDVLDVMLTKLKAQQVEFKRKGELVSNGDSSAPTLQEFEEDLKKWRQFAIVTKGEARFLNLDDAEMSKAMDIADSMHFLVNEYLDQIPHLKKKFEK